MRTLRVLTLNLWNDAGDVERRMEAALMATRTLGVDLIGLQEVREAPGGLRQAERFARAIGGTMEFAAADPHSPRGPVGNAIVSRLPISHASSIALPSPDDDPRVALAAEVATPAGPMAFISTHLSYRPEQSPVRERQVLALDQFARDRRRALPTVMCGDFNTSPDSDAIRFLTGRASLDGRGTYWRDTFARVRPHEDGYTWSAHNPHVVRHIERNRRIDYIFIGPLSDDGRGAVIEARVELSRQESNGEFPSDHFGVFAEIALDPIDEPHW